MINVLPNHCNEKFTKFVYFLVMTFDLEVDYSTNPNQFPYPYNVLYDYEWGYND